MPDGFKNALLALIILTYVALGVAYAVETPPWQAPDEPAHYNYVRTLAETGRLPVLRMGDYDQQYLEEIKARRFPPDMPVDSIRYESWQPPLYYALAAVVYAATGGSLIALRLLGVALGAVLLWLTYRIVSDVFPDDAALALGTTAFVAAVPMHVATTAAVNNDTLAELVLAAVLWLLVQYVREAHGPVPPVGAGSQPEGLRSFSATALASRSLLPLGVLIGLGVWTKTTTFIAIPLALIVLVVHGWRRRARATAIGCRLLAVFGPAAAIALPWLARNAWVYGWPDVFAWQRHAAVVVGQPRTAEWVARFGVTGVLERLAVTTFCSFWAQFGWMGVLVDERIYLGLLVLCGVVGLGFGLWLWRMAGQRHTLTSHQWASLGLLALSALLTGGAYLWYNLTFVQHQGRYLFPALVPIGLAFALGLREALRRDRARWLAALCAVGLVLLAGAGLLSGDFHKWGMALLAAAGVALGLKSLLPDRFDPWAYALPYLGLFALDAVCLWWFIVPYFA